MYHGFEGHGWGMAWIWIVGLIIFIAIIVVVVRSVNQNNRPDRTPHKTALDILKERYARGEIDKQEFEERKSNLM